MTPRLVRQYLEELELVHGKSPNTIETYGRDLRLLLAYLEEHQTLEQFNHYLLKRGLGNRSQARTISTVRTFLRHIHERGKRIPDLRHLKTPKFKAPLPIALTVAEFKLLLDVSEENVTDAKKRYRNRIVLYLLFGLGCRVTELINLRPSDVNSEERHLKVQGKGGKERLIPLPENIIGELDLYISTTLPAMNVNSIESLILNDHGNKPTRLDIWRWIKKWAKLANLESRIAPHTFRHGMATALVESGADIRSVQEFLGHASIETTALYSHISTKMMLETIDRFHPLSRVGVS